MTNLLAVPTSHHPSLSTEFPSVLAVDAGEARCEGSPRAAAAEVSASDPTTEPIRKSRAKGRKCHKKNGPRDEAKGGTTDAQSGRVAKPSGSGARRVEREAEFLALLVKGYINKSKGSYLKADDGNLYVLINGKRISLDESHRNSGLEALLLNGGDFTLRTNTGRAALDRIRKVASERAGDFSFRRFSAMSEQHDKLYLPLQGGKLLRVSRNGIATVENGENEDKLWIEHPNGDKEALNFRLDAVAAGGLQRFEELVVDTQACEDPSMRWFVAMEEGLFPYLRDMASARIIVAHRGGQGDGKTTGAQWFYALHGRGIVEGDASIAALSNAGDAGFLVWDNKEQASLSEPKFRDYLMFLSTGGRRTRSSSDGFEVRATNTFRPVAVLTSIEGVGASELQRRVINVEYQASALDKKLYEPETILAAIKRDRHLMLSAAVAVMQEYIRLKQAGEMPKIDVPDAFQDFPDNYRVLCGLMFAYEHTAGKAPGWADSIIGEWKSVFASAQKEEDEFQFHVFEVLQSEMTGAGGDRFSFVRASLRGQEGYVAITTAAALAFKLGQRFPRSTCTASAIGRRVKKLNGNMVYHVDAQCVEVTGEVRDKLKRDQGHRRLGLFFVPENTGDLVV